MSGGQDWAATMIESTESKVLRCENRDGVHIVHPIMDSTTLCGDSMDGVELEDECGESHLVDDGPITCQRCREIMRVCREAT